MKSTICEGPPSATFLAVPGLSTSVSNAGRWDLYGLREARLAAEQSKDPSTRVGACILDQRHRIVSKGWNGFARGIRDVPERLQDRATKLALVLHAEENALAFAESWRLSGATLYCYPVPPCAHCTSLAVQHGVARVLAPVPEARFIERWGDNLRLARMVAREAGLIYDTVLLPTDWEKS